MKNTAILTPAGSLGRIYNSAIDALIWKIGPQAHADAYVGDHDGGFAESEFAGKYLDTCVRLAATDHDPERAAKAFQDAKTVARSIISNQYADGYIGGMVRGKEKCAFAVWNQAFTMIGLCSFAAAFPRDPLAEAAKEAARKIAHYNAKIFMNDKSILDGGNNGSQHLSLLLGLTRLYKLSPDELTRDFIVHIVGCIESSDNNFFSFDSILDLRSKKGIENFVILIGMLEYGDLFDDLSALAACEKYWDELAETQIRKNGNGTVHEVWTDGGNKPRLVGLDENPDENCVAVGWIELSLALYWRKGGKKYIDAVERSVFNHLLGALSEDGTDFAYYQPNFGRRITKTIDGYYQCCRYRGFSAVSLLPLLTFRRAGDTLESMLYTGCEYSDDDVKICEKSIYPYGNRAEIKVEKTGISLKTLRLRTPDNAGMSVHIDGQIFTDIQDGYIVLDLEKLPEKFTVDIDFDIKPVLNLVDIDGKKYAYGEYGCLLLAEEFDCPDCTVDDGRDAENKKLVTGFYLDIVRNNSKIRLQRDEKLSETDSFELYRTDFTAVDKRFTDFASAGREDGKAFTVFVPVAE